jgi:hypothetical protein
MVRKFEGPLHCRQLLHAHITHLSTHVLEGDSALSVTHQPIDYCTWTCWWLRVAVMTTAYLCSAHCAMHTTPAVHDSCPAFIAPPCSCARPVPVYQQRTHLSGRIVRKLIAQASHSSPSAHQTARPCRLLRAAHRALLVAPRHWSPITPPMTVTPQQPRYVTSSPACVCGPRSPGGWPPPPLRTATNTTAAFLATTTPSQPATTSPAIRNTTTPMIATASNTDPATRATRASTMRSTTTGTAGSSAAARMISREGIGARAPSG